MTEHFEIAVIYFTLMLFIYFTLIILHIFNFSLVPNMGSGRDGICKTWGQYHFETFDGIYYYFPGSCSYIFAKDCGNLEPQYTVWVGGTKTLSLLKKLPLGKNVF